MLNSCWIDEENVLSLLPGGAGRRPFGGDSVSWPPAASTNARVKTTSWPPPNPTFPRFSPTPPSQPPSPRNSPAVVMATRRWPITGAVSASSRRRHCDSRCRPLALANRRRDVSVVANWGRHSVTSQWQPIKGVILWRRRHGNGPRVATWLPIDFAKNLPRNSR